MKSIASRWVFDRIALILARLRGEVHCYAFAATASVIPLLTLGGASRAVSLNPLQIAILRWYSANQAGNTFATGIHPNAVAFDGANIWVTNYGDNTVNKL